MDINSTKIIKALNLGNGLTPISDVKEGELLIRISSPLLILVEQEALNKVCSYCLSERPQASLKRCSGCKIPRYCSTACQKKDWISIHQKECPILKKLPGVPPTAVRGMIQMLLRNQKSPGLDSVWMNLESHLKELRESKRWDEIVLQSKAAVEFSGSPKDSIEYATNLLCRMSTNAFRATLPDDTPIGLCFSPTIALANHSCSPNAAIIFDGRSISLRSLNVIKRGEQIFISYIDPVQTRTARRTELKERYFFTCECDVCRGDQNPYEMFLQSRSTLPVKMDKAFEVWWDPEKLKAQAEKYKSNAHENIITPVLSTFSVSQVQTIVERSRAASEITSRLNLLEEAVRCLSPLTGLKCYALPPLPMVLNELYTHHLDIGDFMSALILLLFVSKNCDPYNYPQPTNPIRVLRLYTIAKLLKHIASIPTDSLLPPATTPFNEDQRHAIRNVDYVSAVQVFLILTKELGEQSHGVESRFMKEVEEELADVESVQMARNGGGVGLELRRWMKQGGMAVEGKLLAETVVGGLRALAGFVGRIVGDLKGGEEEEE